MLYHFRHTFAAHQSKKGILVKILAELMGYEDTSPTMKNYVKITDKMISQ